MSEPFLPQEVIRKKRDGGALTESEIVRLVAGITDGTVTEGQAAAFAMAVFFRGLDHEEQVALTLAMTRSGQTLDWSRADLPGPALDKHSTGGIGDKVSLILAPLVACCGGVVPMISGRGLGHTGGTLDKLEAIPGYRIQVELAHLRHTLKQVGCAIVGAGPELAPADRRLYAVRDVTATVESLPLIVASILAKKLAAGLDALVIDVKSGSGAFLPKAEDAAELAEALVAVANAAGLRTAALVTDMDFPLGFTAGNGVEVRESIAYLTGEARSPRLVEVTNNLTRLLLLKGGVVTSEAEAARRIEAALASGEAAERFGRMVAALGGPSDLVEHPDKYLPTAPIRMAVTPAVAGHVVGADTRAIGVAILEMGGGRRRVEDSIDHAVGLTDLCQPGEAVGPGHPLGIVHARTEAQAERAAAALRAAIRVAEEPAMMGPVIISRLESP